MVRIGSLGFHRRRPRLSEFVFWRHRWITASERAAYFLIKTRSHVNPLMPIVVIFHHTSCIQTATEIVSAWKQKSQIIHFFYTIVNKFRHQGVNMASFSGVFKAAVSCRTEDVQNYETTDYYQPLVIVNKVLFADKVQPRPYRLIPILSG